MRRIKLAVLVSLLPTLVWAGTLAALEPVLRDEVAARRAALPTGGLTRVQKKQQAALGRAEKALGHDGSLAANLADARTAAVALGGAYRGDATLNALLNDLVALLTTDVQGRHAGLASGRDALATGAVKTKVSKKLDRAERALSAAGATTSPAGALKLLSRALAQVTAGEQTLGVPGGGGAPTTTDFTLDLAAPAADHVDYPSVPADVLDRHTTIVSGTGPTSVFTIALGAVSPTTTFHYSVMLFVLGPGSGDRPITTTGSGLSIVPGGTTLLTSGTIHFSYWNPAEQKCAGTFTATFGTQSVTGSFSTTMMIVQ